jgi:hydroxymethylglutaryl-CoA reductase (NADPH)
LEYANCEQKEIQVYHALTNLGHPSIPSFYGAKIDEQAEIYLLFMERLDAAKMLLFNSENHPEKWTEQLKMNAIQAIHAIHTTFVNDDAKGYVPAVAVFDPSKALELYRQFNRLNAKDYEFLNIEASFQYLDSVLDQWTEEMPVKKSKLTLVHNDFNPRNVSVRLDGRLCIYDWELASYNIPQRDVFEFLAFTLVEDFTFSELENVLKQHFHLMKEWNDTAYSYQDYLDDFKIAGDEFLLTRVSFYMAGSTLVHYPFINRVFTVALKMIQSI